MRNYRLMAQAFLAQAGDHLISLSDTPETDSDRQFDSFIREWRRLPARPKGEPAYVGIFGEGKKEETVVARRACLAIDVHTPSYELKLGKFSLWEGTKCLGSWVATSGAAGYQTEDHFNTKNAGILPPEINKLSTKYHYAPSVIGVEGGWFDLLPWDLPNRQRGAFGLHYDANVPGSAGCIVILDKSSFENTIAGILKGWENEGVSEVPLVLDYATSPAMAKPTEDSWSKAVKVSLPELEESEGFRSKPYLCSADVPTIGIGTTIYMLGKKAGKRVTLADAEITRAEAEAEKIAYINQVCKPALSPFLNDLNINQIAALISFVYNIGNGAFAESTLLRRLLAKDYADVPNQMRRWIHGGAGLAARREREIQLWNRKVQ